MIRCGLPPGFRYMTPADVYPCWSHKSRQIIAECSAATRAQISSASPAEPGISITAAQTEMQTIAAALIPSTGEKYGQRRAGRRPCDRIVGEWPQRWPAHRRGHAAAAHGCVNLAGLLLNKSAARGHELRIRAAIGASRRRLVGQLLIEQALLVVAGGVLGALAGAAILTGLVSLAPRSMPRLDEIRLDVVVLSWTTCFCCACAFLFGVVPAVHTSGASGQQLVIRSGRGSIRSASFLRRSLMIAEIAVATVLLSGAGLMVHTMLRLGRVDPGFDPHNLQTVMFSLAAMRGLTPETGSSTSRGR